MAKLDLQKQIDAISKEPITREFTKWTIKNNSDKTDLKLWRKGMRDFSDQYGGELVKMVEDIGKQTP